MIILCSHTLFFTAARLALGMKPEPEILVDHYTPGTFLYMFEEGKPPSGVDVEGVRREAQS